MDILNWLYLRAEKLIKTTANNPETDLVAIGADVTFAKRDDKYKTYAMPIKDLVQAGLPANTGYYPMDIAVSNIVTVSTPRGIIDITNMGTAVTLTPDPAFGSSTPFYIDNPDLDLTPGNIDNIYVQYSIYYSQGLDDNAIPYLISTGSVSGLEFNLYNANPAAADTDNWKGSLYVYFELYTIN